MVLVNIRAGGDGVSAQSAAESYVKREFGVTHADILKVEYAGRQDNGHHIMLVTFKEKHAHSWTWNGSNFQCRCGATSDRNDS